MVKNYYHVLVVERNASQEDITKAFREIGKKCHPDLYPGDVARESMFKSASEAYETLKDPNRRRRYDLLLDEKNDSPRSFFRDQVQLAVNLAHSVYGSNSVVRGAKIITDVATGERDLNEKDLEDIGRAGMSLIEFLTNAIHGRYGGEDGT